MLVTIAYGIAFIALFTAGMVIVNAVFWPKACPAAGGACEPVSILIPARNEAANIGACLESLSTSTSEVCEILVYDDHSTDDTAAIVCNFSLLDERIRLISASPLPDGWCGKNYACYLLAQEARGTWLLFVDADTRAQGTLAASAVWAAHRYQASFISFWPGLELLGIWEKILMPMLNFIVLSLYPAPLSFRRPDASLGIAHGACILAHRETYTAIGGHELVRGEIFEDTRLAQAWRAHGELSLCIDGQDQIRVRMYTSFGEIWRGFQKNFYTAFKSPIAFWGFMALHALVFTAPFAALPLLPIFPALTVPLVSACVFILFSRVVLQIRFGQSVAATVAHPIAQVVLIALGISSWWRCASGRGVEWKGRAYRRGPASPIS